MVGNEGVVGRANKTMGGADEKQDEALEPGSNYAGLDTCAVENMQNTGRLVESDENRGEVRGKWADDEESDKKNAVTADASELKVHLVTNGRRFAR